MNALAVLSSRERSYDRARQELEDIIMDLESEEARSMTHSDLERELEKRSRELMRKLLQGHLQACGPGECVQPIRGSDGVERTRVRSQERKLETIFGTVSAERAAYGQKGTQSLHPLDAELNLPRHIERSCLRRKKSCRCLRQLPAHLCILSQVQPLSWPGLSYCHRGH